MLRTMLELGDAASRLDELAAQGENVDHDIGTWLREASVQPPRTLHVVLVSAQTVMTEEEARVLRGPIPSTVTIGEMIRRFRERYGFVPCPAEAFAAVPKALIELVDGRTVVTVVCDPLYRGTLAPQWILAPFSGPGGRVRTASVPFADDHRAVPFNLLLADPSAGSEP